MLGTLDLAGSEHWAPFYLISLEHIIMQPCENLFLIQTIRGLLIFRGKKSKILRDFRGQIHGKIGRFRGIFTGKKSKLTEKSADFAGEKSKFLEKLADFTGNFGGKLPQETISKKQLISPDFFWQSLRRYDQRCLPFFLTGIIICSVSNSAQFFATFI